MVIIIIVGRGDLKWNAGAGYWNLSSRERGLRVS
jgi:hypothetical protein